MAKKKLFQYAILWHPTEKQENEEGLKSKLIKDVTNVLVVDQELASMEAAMSIDPKYRDQLDQIEICIRPF